MHQERKIVKATLGPMPRPMPEGMSDPMPTVTVTFDDGAVVELFQFYPDEITFTPEGFIGLTEAEARALRHKKDVSFLKAP